MKDKKLYRSCDDRLIAGVCGGLGEYFDIDSSIVRLVFALLLIAGGSGLLVYIIAWVVIPSDPKCVTKETGAEEIKQKAETFAKEVKKELKDHKSLNSTKTIFGLIVLLLGITLLMENLFGLHLWQNIWPIVVIAVGIVIIMKSKK